MTFNIRQHRAHFCHLIQGAAINGSVKIPTDLSRAETMNIKLPEPIEDYFRFRAEGKSEQAAASFARDAVIIDEGEDHEVVGRDAISQWFAEIADKYKTTLEVVGSVEEEGNVVVTTLVSGNFPGSPAEFLYRFSVRNALIERLVIEFTGFK